MATQDIAAQTLECLRYLAGNCDGASSVDGHGFNKIDTHFGHELAMREYLTTNQIIAALRMLKKYSHQLEKAGLVVPTVMQSVKTTPEPIEEEDIMEAEPITSTVEDLRNDETPIETKIVLSGEQKAVFEMMESTKQHLFITGRAGTGKSVLLRHFRENTKKKVVVAAPTGIAALNVRGQTIHSLFRLAPQFHRKGTLEPNSRACMILKRIETLVIDEISMVRADLIDAIDERLREAHKNDLPFGGVQVIMFGDVYQLPPVVEEGLLPYFEHIYGGYFFFHASVWQQTKFKIYELSQIFRQKDPIFKNILNAVRDGTVTDEQIEQLNARCNKPVPAEGTITLAATNNLVTTINQRRLDQLEGKVYEYKAIITGKMSRGTFPTEEVIQLKVGAQVVLLQNDKDKRWVNGTVATISSLEKGIEVHVDGIDYPLERATWEEIRYEYDPIEGKVKEEVTSSFTQYPIRLAWAMTIHKSQGQTYESVALDLTSPTFAPGQIYVALSRCTSLEGLYLKIPVKRGHVIVEPKVTEFMARREAIAIEVVEEAQEVVAIAESILAPVVESTPEQETVKPVETPAISLPKIENRGGRGHASDWVKVAYKFSPEVVEKLNKMAEANPGMNKSAFIDGLLAQWFEEHGI